MLVPVGLNGCLDGAEGRTENSQESSRARRQVCGLSSACDTVVGDGVDFAAMVAGLLSRFAIGFGCV